MNYLQQANHRSDKRLAALETLEAGKSLTEGLNAVNAFSNFSVSDVQNAYDKAAASAARDAELARATKQPKDVIAAKELQVDELNRIAKDPKAVQERYNQEKAAKRDSLVNIHVGIGSSHSKSVTEVNETTYAGGSIQSADGTVRIIARGNTVETNANTNGNITAIGQTIRGKVVDLQAKGDVNLLAGTNTTHVTEDSTSSGWSVGASIGTTGFLGGDIGINKAKSEGLTDRTTHTGTTVVGSYAVTITSGQDTNVVGSTVSGNKVVAKVGNDLTITSVQDMDNYKSTSKTSGMSISYTPGHAGIVSGGTTKGDIHSQYRSVTSQAGIYAGTDGYDITVKDNTTLTGSVIDSKAASNVNRLTTGSLIMKDIDNEASYEASSRGFNISTAKGTGLNPLGLGKVTTIPVSGDGSSTTRSAIADGIISVADTQSVSDINHNTKDALQTLGQIFDKKKVEEKQEMVNLMAKNGYAIIGDIAVSKQKKLVAKALEDSAHKDMKSAKEYLEEAKKWEEGGTYKSLLHGALGGVLSGIASGNISSGFMGASGNELLQQALGKIQDPELHKLASLVIGKTVGGDSGGAIAEIATDENWLNHYDQMAMLKDIMEYKDNGILAQGNIMDKLAYYIALSNKTAAYADTLGINDSIDGTVEGGHSLAWYLGLGENTLAAGIYGFAEAEGIDRTVLDAAVQSHEAYMDYDYLRMHYPMLNGNAEDRYSAWSKNSEMSLENTWNKGMNSYVNKGDYYADRGYKVLEAPDGNHYVIVNHEFLYTTREAHYSKAQFGDGLADYGWMVKREYWNGVPVNAVEYNGKSYFANRQATDGTIIGASANEDVSIINGVAIAIDRGGNGSSGSSGGAEYAGEDLTSWQRSRIAVTPDFGHVSLVFYNNTGSVPEELNFGRYGKDDDVMHSHDRFKGNLFSLGLGSGGESGSFGRFQGTYVVDSSFNPGEDYKDEYVLNLSPEESRAVATTINDKIRSGGYTPRKEEVWLTPKRKGDAAYRISGDTDSYDLTSNNCATTTIAAIKEALGNRNVEVNKDTVAKLLKEIRPSVVAEILDKDYEKYQGRGLVREIHKGKR